MLIPVVEEFRSSKTPWQVYRALYPAAKTSFFLDSIRRKVPDQSYSYISSNPFMEVSVLPGKKPQVSVAAAGKNKMFPARRLVDVLRAALEKYKAPEKRSRPFFTGGAVGYWGYEMAFLFDRVRLKSRPSGNLPWMYFGFFRDLIVYDHARKIYYLVTHTQSRNVKSAKREAAPALARLRGLFGRESGPLSPFEFGSFKPEISRSKFERMVKKAKNYIRAGDIYQANLSQRFSFQWKGDPLGLYGRLREINPSPFSSFFKIGGLHIVSSSPERLAVKRGRLCETKPIAGTRPRLREKKSQRVLQKELLTNEKERAEHLMLVDLERNDLGKVCEWKSVRVTKMMDIERYSHVTHIVSTISGRLKKEMDALDLLKAMFPGGTITGCPKIRCMEIINELERRPRGLYTGSLGYIDFSGNMDMNIVIRTLVLQGRKGHFQVGAGIVHDSDPAKEYEETLHKGEAMAHALVRAGKTNKMSRYRFS